MSSDHSSPSRRPSSLFLAPTRISSSTNRQWSETGFNTSAVQTPNTPSPRRSSFRQSYQFPPSYQASARNSSYLEDGEKNLPDMGQDQTLTDPFQQQYEAQQSQQHRPPSSFYSSVVLHASPRSHVRRSSLSNSIKNGVRSLGRRLSISRTKDKDSQEESSPPESSQAPHADLNQSEQSGSRPQTSRSFFQSLADRHRPSMPLLRAHSSNITTNALPTPSPAHYTGDKVLRPRPSFHRATTTERTEYFAGGAGARASAAIHNEALQIARATPLPPYRPRSRSPSFEDIKDSESGIGIMMDDLDRTSSRIPRIARFDPVDMLAPELLEHVLSFLNAETLLQVELVSKQWREISRSQTVWRQVFYTKYAPTRSRRVKGGPKTAGLGKNTPGQDFRKLYQIRAQIDQRWERGQAAAIYLTGHKDSVYCLQFDEEKIITGSRDNTVRVWDARTYQCVRKLAPPNNHRERNELIHAEVEPRGIIPFQRFEARSVEPKAATLPIWHHASILCLQYDEEILVTGSSDFTAIVWSIKDNYKPIFRLEGHRAGVLDVAIDPYRIITCSKDTTIKIWNRWTGQLIKTLNGHQGPVNAVQVRSNLLASASGDGCSKLWRLDTGMCIKEFHSAKRGLACVEFSEDGRSIFAGGNDHVIYEYDTATGGIRRELKGHKELVRSLHLDSANKRIISGSYDHTIKVWDNTRGTSLEDGGLKCDLRGWTSSWMLAAKSNYRKIAAASQDGRVVVVDFGFGINGVDLVEA